MSKMSARQKQGIMATTMDTDGNFYFNGKLDGIWGPESQKAAERFLADFSGQVEEAPQKPPDSFWDELEYFDREEFCCKCGGLYCNGFPAEPSEQTARYANEIRKRLGVPLRVNSGLRCEVWNRLNEGASLSQHKTGHACDLGAPAGVSPEKMASVAEEVIGNTGGIGIYDWGIHIDDRKEKTRWRG
jgi:hypothetical protein